MAFFPQPKYQKFGKYLLLDRINVGGMAEVFRGKSFGVEGFGNTKRNHFRRPAQWGVDVSLFKAFPIGRLRPELRVDVTNVFNHFNWGAPNTTFTSPQFMLYNPGSVDYTAVYSPRRVQIGFRVEF